MFTGYALGSLLGGILITLYEMRVTFRIFGGIALVTAIIHYILYMVYLRKKICTSTYLEIIQEIM